MPVKFFCLGDIVGGREKVEPAGGIRIGSATSLMRLLTEEVRPCGRLRVDCFFVCVRWEVV